MRFAIYAAPRPDHPLWRLGSAILGYDAATGGAVPFPAAPPCDSRDWPELSAEPRRYGFHGTLKAPFRPSTPDRFEARLTEALDHFVASRRPFAVPLEVALLGRFVALVPAGPVADLAALAADCVREFDAFRAPLSAQERERRLASPLSARQIELLDRWGYPYVLEEFRYHMTLTGPLPAERREGVRNALARLCGSVDTTIDVDALVLFRQDAPDQAFRIVARHAFRG